jgi:hypothetical protein
MEGLGCSSKHRDFCSPFYLLRLRKELLAAFINTNRPGEAIEAFPEQPELEQMEML